LSLYQECPTFYDLSMACQRAHGLFAGQQARGKAWMPVS